MPGPVVGPLTFEVSRAVTVTGQIAETFSISAARADELVRFGAVYWNSRRLYADRMIKPGDWLRVHGEPRRFPSAQIDWPSRLVHEEEEFLVLDKPHGIPSHATCDNAVENVLHSARVAFGQELLSLHRLDVATGGLVVFAKTPAFQKRFSRWLETRQVRKRYRALIPKPVALGLHVHYLDPTEKWPRRVSEIEQEGWKRCALSVESIREVPAYDAFEVELDLQTGRNHQIRCQLSRLGASLLGDDLYGSDRFPPKRLGSGEVIALQSCAIAFPDGGNSERIFALTVPW